MSDDLRRIPGPVWVKGNETGCSHKASEYVASFECWHAAYGRASYDLHLFDERGEQHVCIRTSNEAQDYISPGALVDFIYRTGGAQGKLPAYQVAYEILREVFLISAVRKVE